MRLTDLARNLPVVTRSTTALEAARRIAGDRLSALVVAREGGEPELVVPAVDVLGLLIPCYLREDTRLAAVLDDAAADELWRRRTAAPSASCSTARTCGSTTSSWSSPTRRWWRSRP